MKKRVLLAGLFHESHTFLDGATPLSDFQIRAGDAMFKAAGDGSPLDGVLSVAIARNWDVLPALDVRCLPGPAPDDSVLEFFWREFKQTALSAKGIDGIFLILHGAMACPSHPDVEGELLERIHVLPQRADIPVCGVLDLHANFSARMAEYSDALVDYRENPHTDARAVAVDAAELLDRLMRTGERPSTVWVRPPLIWTPQGTATARDPMQSLELAAREIERTVPGVLACNVHAGFAYADTPDTGVSFSAVTLGDQNVARHSLERLAAMALEMRSAGLPAGQSVDDCMSSVKRHSHGLVVVAEPSDNIGGGAPGDGTGLLRALIAHAIHDAAVAICDPQTVSHAAEIGVGRRLRVALGGKGSRFDAGPVELDVDVLSLSDGKFDLEDRHSHLASVQGVHFDMGRCAVLRHEGIRVLVTSRPTPPFDLGQYRSQGIVPELLFVVGVKAAAAHRQAYDKIAAAHYTVETPGPCPSDLRTLPYARVRRPVYPLDEF